MRPFSHHLEHRGDGFKQTSTRALFFSLDVHFSAFGKLNRSRPEPRSPQLCRPSLKFPKTSSPRR